MIAEADRRRAGVVAIAALLLVAAGLIAPALISGSIVTAGIVARLPFPSRGFGTILPLTALRLWRVVFARISIAGL